MGSLQREVQCFDNTAGCASTLYNLQIVQATGFVYDCYAFQAKASGFQDGYRAAFLAALRQANPRVLVVSDQNCFTLSRNFDRLATWPGFEEYLGSHYSLYVERDLQHRIAWWRHPAPPFSYRIYVRR